MVVTVAKATSADYYVGAGGVTDGVESYYLDAVTAGEPAGEWSGSGARQLGLAGEVTADDMRSVFSDFVNPITGEAIGSAPAKRASVQQRLEAALAAEPDALPERVEEIRSQLERSDRQSVIGWDATFSVAKSVTVVHTAAHRAELAAIRSGDVERAERFGAIRMGIEDAIQQANRAMLDYAETVAVTRTGRHGGHSQTARWEPAPGLTVASFVQHTNRNIDPQLHVHNVILNRAFSADGKARSLDGRDLLAQRHGLGAVADRTLEEALTAQGFRVELRPDGMARELTVVPTQVAELFSSRDQQVSARIAELLPAAEERSGRRLTDYEIYKLKKIATLSTRTSKNDHVPETREEMIDRWWASTIAVGSDLDHIAHEVDAHLASGRGDRPGGQPVAPEGLEAQDDGRGWSPSAVIAEAVAACGQSRSAWRASDLMLEIHRRLPSLGGLDGRTSVEVLKRLTDQALTGSLVRQVSGHLDHPDDVAAGFTAEAAPASASDVAAALRADPFTRPSAHLYATVDTLAAEEALRRAGIERGARTLDAEQVSAWLDHHAPSIGADQRAAVVGIAASDARLAVLVGPAGTGKSFAAGTLAHAWHDLTDGEGRMIGLTVSDIASQVLRDEGIEHARNIDRWLATQDRLSAGSTFSADLTWRVGPDDLVMVDEASMVATADLDRIRGLVESAGARLVLTGDPRQLGAVEAGGVMGLLDGHAETYTLSDVRRFTAPWEASTSLAVRDGRVGALADYDRHGRLLSYDTQDQAIQAAANAAVADRVDGHSVVVVTPTNAQAGAVASAIRDQLVDLGLVEANGTLLGRDSNIAGVGDLIAARRNDYAIGVTNRAHYRVTAVGADGSLTVVPTDRDTPSRAADEAGDEHMARIVLPPEYVAEDVQLGYASTAHGAQGVTVDAAHLVTDGQIGAAALYVGLSRGRDRNTAHVSLNAADPQNSRPAARTGNDGQIQLRDTTTRPSARAVLETALEQEENNRAATVEAELDAARLSNMSLLTGRYESVVRTACRERLDRHLDDLTADGTLDRDTRTRLGADQATEHLSRLLRAVEQAGADPRQTLTDAVTARDLNTSASVAQVLTYRIAKDRPLPGLGSDIATATPADIAPQAAQHLQHLRDRIDRRTRDLGEQAAAEQPGWLLPALGPAPADESARSRWQDRAGLVAAYREATGWDSPHQAIGGVPGVHTTERRAAFAQAWQALGRPEAGLEEAGMTEGQLRIRIRAARSEHAWAPPHADAALRAAEVAAETARQDAALARAAAAEATRSGDHERADKLLLDAERHEQTRSARSTAIPALEQAADTRTAWAASAAPTLEVGRRAQAEADRRGLRLGAEPDHTTTQAWLDAERQTRVDDDKYREITETNLIDESDDHHHHTAQPDPSAWRQHSAAHSPTSTPVKTARNQSDGRTAAHATLPEDITAAEVEAMTAGTALVMSKVADRANQDATAPPADADTDSDVDYRRRQSADHDTYQSATTSDAGSSHGTEYGRG